MTKSSFIVIMGCMVLLHAGIARAEDESLLACTDKTIAQTELGQNLAKNPLFTALSGTAGVTPVCTQSIVDGSLSVTITGAPGNVLAVSIVPALESSSYEATLNGLSEARAKTLLKATEKYVFGNEGCGIDWKKSHREPGENGTSMIVFQAKGDGNNCMAHEIFKGGTLTGVSLGNAS